MTTLLTNLDQLKSASLLQLGSDNHPCTVVFGASKFDEGKPYRAIKITCPEIDIFRAYDADVDQHPFVKEYKDQSFITIKIGADTEMPCSLPELNRDTSIVVIVRAVPWAMTGNSGISLRCEMLKVVTKQKEPLKFLD